MNVVVIGDIGWPKVYHLGDEAMTEAAMAMLRARGIDDFTLISADPAVATSFYGCPAVRRPGFRKAMTRGQKERRLRDLTKALEGDGSFPSGVEETVQAVEEADAVLIAGGGNMNSKSVHYLFDRLALTRMAKRFGKPVFVTSQTVGPSLTDEDVPLVREILDYAVCFGAREHDTFELLRRIASDPSVVHHTLDDAAMLTPHEETEQSLAGLKVPPRYIVGSFTDNAGTSGLSKQEYHDAVARSLDHMSAVFDADVLLIPHMGAREPSEPRSDELTHDAITRSSRSQRVSSVGLIPAREALSVMSGAIVSISTRYHPLVLGPAVGVPAVGLSTSYYSSVRMRGALGNIGLSDLVVPVDFWRSGRFSDFVSGVHADLGGLVEHVQKIAPSRAGEQGRWWDAIAASIRGAAWPGCADLAEVEPWRLQDPALREILEISTRLSDDLGQERQVSALLRSELAARKRDADDLKRISREVKSLRSKVARAAAALQDAPSELDTSP